MGLLEELRQEIESKRIFKLPDSREIKLRVITAKAMLMRTGAIPSVLTKQALGEVEDSVDAADLSLAVRMLEAFFVLGIEEVDGEPVRICFSDEPKCEGGLFFDHFLLGIARRYGVSVVEDLYKQILEVSGYPPEVAAEAAKEFERMVIENWRKSGFLGMEGGRKADEVAAGDPHDRQGLRGNPGRNPEPADR